MTKNRNRNRNRTLHVLGKRNAVTHGKRAPQQFTVIKEGLRPVRETLVGFFLCVAQNIPSSRGRSSWTGQTLKQITRRTDDQRTCQYIQGEEKSDGPPTRGNAGAGILS